MGRIMSIDYGTKRCGVATTDPLQIIVSALDTVGTKELYTFLENYMKNEKVDKIVFGKPSHADGTDTYLVKEIEVFISKFSEKFSELEFDFQDESFTSVQARDIIMLSGARKKKRRDKSLIDKVSAVIILQKYLNHI